ncbi:M13 family metallopeptidase [Rhizobium rosettiformans]|uniref:M13 family metallopeptidase n=1 Tax=Rhizobium rosettiformans TaxID=1368430 RepID=UPI00286261FD|nr:M13 family metallopeptidase [Rhizobium rosettiformans]MDR7030768.1 putative metalloendopeptidase [Rhizobium rosettiformans]MDR7062611.1 putative metalloendopeptidase [Rhizobium rosettiformans]
MLRLTSLALLSLSASVTALAAGQVPVPDIGPDQLSFSITNMDPSVDPRTDFYRYAAGGWLDRVERPADRVSIDTFDFMGRRLTAQMQNLMAEAGEKSVTAEKGSPLQQVGAFYNAYMDTPALDAKGITPIEPELARIDAIASMDDLATYLGRYITVAGEVALIGLVPSTDQADTTKMALFLVEGSLIFNQENLYDAPPGSELDLALRGNLRQVLETAGYDAERAAAVVDMIADLERELHSATLTPVEAMNPANSYQPKSFADIQAEIPTLDLSRMLAAVDVAPPDRIVLTQPRYLAALEKMLKDRPIGDIKDYLKVRVINHFKPYLGTRFDAAAREWNKIVYGIDRLPPRSELVQSALQSNLGHPVSRLYVERHFTEDTKAKARDMVERVHQTFQNRMQTRDWLAPDTKKAALEKLEKLSYKIGYPESWIDYGSVEIRADDLVGNIMRLTAFDAGRTYAKLGKPAVSEDFSDSRTTLPVIINAGYSMSKNGFEVPAAILQPAAFEAEKDAATYFCRIGAVLGHEMTHGFDSRGRLYDAKGNLNDWWKPEDAAAFEKEAQKLVEQASAYEVLPGLKLNGALSVGENMADVGGINFAYGALQDYIAEHPEENVSIDGLTPAQRCFISWTQFWAMKVTDQAIRSVFMSNAHPPGFYRATAALKHVDAFYEAFDISEGDKEWLPPDRRVRAW